MIAPQRNLRVLVFARNTVAHRSPGGMETVLQVLSAGLADSGIKLALVTTPVDHGLEQAVRSRLGQFEEVWFVSGATSGRYSRAWWRATRTTGPWDAWRPDAVLSIGDAGGQWSRRRTSVPLVIQCHGTPLMEAASALGGKGARDIARAMVNVARIPSRARALGSASEIWAISPRVQESIAKITLGHVASRFMPNGIDASEYPPRPAGQSQGNHEHRALYLGRLDPQKGVDTAIRAVAEYPGLSLTVGGDGRDRGRLERLSQQLEVTHRVSFRGRLDAAEVRSELQNADVLLLPTRRKEGLPMVLLEAAAAGVPAITTPAASVPEDILATGRVAVVPANDRRALIDATVRATDLPVTTYLPPRYEAERYIADHVHALCRLVSKAKM
ncbi:MAG: hypothetical protein CMF04_00820 [Hyphomonas sp.]|nr:hypothetical protein [Hyphomonas sp.]